MNGMNALIERNTRACFLPLSAFCYVRIQEETAVNKEEGLLQETDPSGPLILDFTASRTVRNKCGLSHQIYGDLLQQP